MFDPGPMAGTTVDVNGMEFVVESIQYGAEIRAQLIDRASWERIHRIPTTIDGVEVQEGDRWLLKSGPPPWWRPLKRWRWFRREKPQNGIYVVRGSWSRHES